MSEVVIKRTFPSAGVRALVGALLLLTFIRIIIQNSVSEAPETPLSTDGFIPAPAGDITVSPALP